MWARFALAFWHEPFMWSKHVAEKLRDVNKHTKRNSNRKKFGKNFKKTIYGGDFCDVSLLSSCCNFRQIHWHRLAEGQRRCVADARRSVDVTNLSSVVTSSRYVAIWETLLVSIVVLILVLILNYFNQNTGLSFLWTNVTLY